jgi:RNA polymerase sigma factor (sigma-70 family)
MAPKALQMASEDRAAHQTDEELAARSADGAQEAFAGLYERHYGGIYDFAIRILRDPDAAADVVQATFTRAWPALKEGTRPANVKAWLYGIARNLSIDELRRRRRLFPTEGLGLGLAELPDPAAFDPSETVETKELAELVWTSAAGLRAEEYALLDLHVRRGLSADELADTLGVQRGAVYTRLTRLRHALESAVATSLLVRHGRGKCSELDRLVAIQRAQGTMHEGRRVIQSHVEDCAQCQESKGVYASPAQILASLALVPPSEELGEAIWAIVGAGAALVGAGAAAASAKTGGVGGLLSQAPVPLGIAAGGLATLATVVTLGVWAAGGDDGGASAAKVSQTPAVEQPAAPPASQPAASAKPRPTRTRAEPARTAATIDRPATVPARPGTPTPAAQFSSVPPEPGKVIARPPASEPPPPSPPAQRPTSPPPPPSPSPPPPSPPRPSPPGPPPPPAPPHPAPPPAPAPPPSPAPPPPPPPPAQEAKVAMCLHGNTVMVSHHAVPGLLRAGATMGACSLADG